MIKRINYNAFCIFAVTVLDYMSYAPTSLKFQLCNKSSNSQRATENIKYENGKGQGSAKTI